MIDAKQALAIADAEAWNLGWGRVSEDRYDARLFEFQGRLAWEIVRNIPVRGHQLRFTIDADQGAIVEKRRMGAR